MRFTLLLFLLPAATALAKPPGSAFVDRSSQLPVEPDADITDTGGIRLADVDNDGDLDLFLAEGTGSFSRRQNRLYINDGTASFTDETATRLPQMLGLSSDVELGDLDGDGDLDALVANVGGEQLLLNDGTGVFTDASAARLPAPLSLFFDITVDLTLADVDNDGDLDALLANELPVPGFAGAQNRLWINDGNATFTDETAARLPTRDDQTAGIAAGDIDGDGDLDAIVANNGQDFVLINDGTGVFTDETATRFPALADSTRDAVLGDVDGDGDLDLFMASSRLQQSRLYLNNGAGVFSDVTTSSLPVLIARATSALMRDFDNDGDLDIYMTLTGETNGSDPVHGFLGAQNVLYVNDGHGHFRDKTALAFPPVLDPSFSCDAEDIDGDGQIDVVVGNSGSTGAEKLYLRRRF